MRHGPHHSAQKSTTTGFSLWRTSVSKVARSDRTARCSRSDRIILARSSGEEDASEGCHQDPVARDARAPAEIQIRVFVIESLVEQVCSLQSFTGDQHRSRRYAQHFEDAIELSLVDLAGLQRGRGMAETI